MVSDKAVVSAEEKDWRARDDARTLADANNIMMDKTRFRSATKKAKIMAKEDEEKAKSIKLVADKKMIKPKIDKADAKLARKKTVKKEKKEVKKKPVKKSIKTKKKTSKK